MENLKRVRYITKNYEQLQGLKQVPVGIFLLSVALSNSGLWPLYTMWEPIPTLLVLALTIGSHMLIGVHYSKKFGQVQPATHSDWDRARGVILVLVFVGAFAVDLSFEPPVSVVGLVLAAWICSGWWRAGWLGVHYAFATMLLIVVSLMPLVGIVSAERLFDVGLPLSFGIVTLIIGTADHLILKHFLSPSPEEGSSAAR